MIKERPERVRPSSPDVAAENVATLKALFPEAVGEDGRIDLDRLRRALGEHVDDGPERYGLSWAGKAEAIRTVQTPSVATLLPRREESVDFDATGNLFIEGDNLEVLKLLQDGYHGAVKMIYIDPPYNTGNDFVYPDNFRDPLETYLRLTGQKDGEGRRLTSNADTSGRYHSAWLSMMYPRLFYARQLLREDGVIFVSIDDNEVHNLRLLMNEVFGEENFVATVIWQRVFAPKNTARYFSEDHDYILVYARDAESWTPRALNRTEEADARYGNPDDDPRGPWASDNLTARNYYSEGQYEVISPDGAAFRPPVGRYWVMKHDKFVELDRDQRIWWGKSGNNMPRLKRFLSEVKQGMVPQTLWKHEAVGHTQDAKKELIAHVDFSFTENMLNSVKPVMLLRRMLQLTTATTTEDIVMDFFSGSATTAHAVLAQNHEDGGNRRFVCVQFPEPLPKPETKLKTIADIGKERIRRVIAKMTAEREGKLDLDGREAPEDLGFRAFSLAPSNFEAWDGALAAGDLARLEEQIAMRVEHVRAGRSREDVLYEIVLRCGLPLTAPVEQRDAAGVPYYAVAGRELYACVEDAVSQQALRAMVAEGPNQIVCLDSAFAGNDRAKTNMWLEARSHGVQFRTI